MFDQMLLYNICHSKFDCSPLNNDIFYRVPKRAARLCNVRYFHLFAPKPCRTNAGERVPLRRAMRAYNDSFTGLDIFHLSFGVYKKEVMGVLADDNDLNQ